MPNRAMPLQSWLSVDISRKISCTQSNHLADQLDLLITSIDSSHPSLVFVCVFLYRKDSVCVFLCVPRLAWGQGHSGSWVDPRLGVTASSAGTLVGTEARHQPRCGRRLSKIEQLDSVCRRTHMEVLAAKGWRTFCTCSIFRCQDLHQEGALSQRYSLITFKPKR